MYGNIKPLRPTSYSISRVASIKLIKRCYLLQVWLAEARWRIYASILVQTMACCLVGAKPLSQPMLWYLNWTLRNKLQWNFNRNSYIFIQRNGPENVVFEMAATLSRPRCVKPFSKHPNLPNRMVHGYCMIVDGEFICAYKIHKSPTLRTDLILLSSYSREFEGIIGN